MGPNPKSLIISENMTHPAVIVPIIWKFRAPFQCFIECFEIKDIRKNFMFNTLAGVIFYLIKDNQSGIQDKILQSYESIQSEFKYLSSK